MLNLGQACQERQFGWDTEEAGILGTLDGGIEGDLPRSRYAFFWGPSVQTSQKCVSSVGQDVDYWCLIVALCWCFQNFHQEVVVRVSETVAGTAYPDLPVYVSQITLGACRSAVLDSENGYVRVWWSSGWIHAGFTDAWQGSWGSSLNFNRYGGVRLILGLGEP